ITLTFMTEWVSRAPRANAHMCLPSLAERNRSKRRRRRIRKTICWRRTVESEFTIEVTIQLHQLSVRVSGPFVAFVIFCKPTGYRLFIGDLLHGPPRQRRTVRLLCG